MYSDGSVGFRSLFGLRWRKVRREIVSRRVVKLREILNLRNVFF